MTSRRAIQLRLKPVKKFWRGSEIEISLRFLTWNQSYGAQKYLKKKVKRTSKICDLSWASLRNQMRIIGEDKNTKYLQHLFKRAQSCSTNWDDGQMRVSHSLRRRADITRQSLYWKCQGIIQLRGKSLVWRKIRWRVLVDGTLPKKSKGRVMMLIKIDFAYWLNGLDLKNFTVIFEPYPNFCVGTWNTKNRA